MPGPLPPFVGKWHPCGIQVLTSVRPWDGAQVQTNDVERITDAYGAPAYHVLPRAMPSEAVAPQAGEIRKSSPTNPLRDHGS
jgi:hypothetical protein